MFDVSRELKSVRCANGCDEWVEIPLCADLGIEFYCQRCEREIDEAIAELHADDFQLPSKYPCCDNLCRHGVPDDEHCDQCGEFFQP